MTWAVLIGAILFAVAVLIFITLTSKKTAPLDKEYFGQRWKELLTYLQSENARQLAVIEADKLLDEALKRRRYGGKTMGERMVSAQKAFSNNNAAWAAHKLRNRLVHEHNVKLRHNEVEAALKNFRQALKDLGAL